MALVQVDRRPQEVRSEAQTRMLLGTVVRFPTRSPEQSDGDKASQQVLELDYSLLLLKKTRSRHGALVRTGSAPGRNDCTLTVRLSTPRGGLCESGPGPLPLGPAAVVSERPSIGQNSGRDKSDEMPDVPTRGPEGTHIPLPACHWPEVTRERGEARAWWVPIAGDAERAEAGRVPTEHLWL